MGRPSQAGGRGQGGGWGDIEPTKRDNTTKHATEKNTEFGDVNYCWFIVNISMKFDPNVTSSNIPGKYRSGRKKWHPGFENWKKISKGNHKFSKSPSLSATYCRFYGLEKYTVMVGGQSGQTKYKDYLPLISMR